MRNKIIKISIVLLGLIIVVGLAFSAYHHWYGQPKSHSRIQPEQTTPTLYLHGYGAGTNSAKNMIACTQSHYDAQRVIIAKVDGQGQVSYEGKWPTGVERPIIQVINTDNRVSDFQQTSGWLKNVITGMHDHYHFQKFNVVAHSMGNLSLMYYLANYGQDKSLPKLEKYVAIAGHFDGILSRDDPANVNHLDEDGRPANIKSYYQYLLDRRDQFDSSKLAVLNIYGNLENGSNSDGSVTNVSSRSLWYLLNGKVASYDELMIKGKQGQHSQLHENHQVDQAVGDFIWGK